MPSSLDPGDRKLLLIAGSLLLLLIVATVALSPPPNEGEGLGIPTTYSASQGGAKAAFQLLGELGYRSERWEKSPTELPTDGAGKILILARPSLFPNKSERAALLAFVRSGRMDHLRGRVPVSFRSDRYNRTAFSARNNARAGEYVFGHRSQRFHFECAEDHDECGVPFGGVGWPPGSFVRSP